MLCSRSHFQTGSCFPSAAMLGIRPFSWPAVSCSRFRCSGVLAAGLLKSDDVTPVVAPTVTCQVKRGVSSGSSRPSKRCKTAAPVQAVPGHGMLGCAFRSSYAIAGAIPKAHHATVVHAQALTTPAVPAKAPTTPARPAKAPESGSCGFRSSGEKAGLRFRGSGEQPVRMKKIVLRHQSADVAPGPGPVDETDAQHAARHQTFRRLCPRCVYIRDKMRLERGYGSYVHPADGGRVRRTIWLAPRPVRLGGEWAVGCLFCAHMRQHCADLMANARRDGRPLPKKGKGPNAANTAWARFEIKNVDQIASRGVRQHSETMQHRKAVKLFFCPDVISVLESSLSASDAELFRGAVPQPEDWLRAWRACRTPQSFRAAQSHGMTETFIRGSRVLGTSNKAVASMVRVMSLVLRSRKCTVLREAKAVSLSLDDCGGFRIVGFKVAMGDGETATGRLGLLRRGGCFSSKELADADDDYSRDMANSIKRAIERLATCPRDGTVDADLVADICQKVYTSVADGASPAQKCLKFLTTFMPHLLWAGRDRAHAARISTSQPLVKEKFFQEWYDDIFDSKHALVPTIKHSEEWLSKLILCEKQVLKSSGVLGGNVTRIMKTVNFAKQRFDSMATPQLQFCTMLVPIAMLLAFQASDHRVSAEVRKRARRRLEQMPGQVPIVGAAASFSGEAMRFVRRFDVADHDPALTYRESRSFVERARRLFMEGHIFDADEENTPLGIVMKAAREADPLYYDDDGKVLRLFRKLSPATAKELADGLSAITESMSERLLVEFSTDDLGVLFTCFDLQRWYTAGQDMQQKADQSGVELLRRHARAMFKDWHLAVSSGVQELETMAFKLVEKEKNHFVSGTPPDNRVAWAQVLKPGFLEENDSCRALTPMLLRYLSAMDSTCGIERDLGALTHVLQAHKGPIDDDGLTIGHCLEVMLDGPLTEDALATHAGGSEHEASLIPSDFMRACAALWLDIHGRRFRIYKAGRKPGPKKHPAGTMAAVGRNVKHAMDKLASRSSGVQEETVLGIARSAFQRSIHEVNPARQAVKLKEFDALTKQKAARSSLLTSLRRRQGNPYRQPELNPDRKLRSGKALRGVQLPGASSGVTVPTSGSVVDAASEAVTPQPGYSVSRAETSAGSLLRQMLRARIVVVDSTCLLDRIVKLSDRGLTLEFLVVALGKCVLDRRAFSRCRHGMTPKDGVVHYTAVSCQNACKLRATDALRQESPLLYEVIGLVARMPKSVWALQGGDALADVTLASRTYFFVGPPSCEALGVGLVGW